MTMVIEGQMEFEQFCRYYFVNLVSLRRAKSGRRVETAATFGTS